MTAQGGKPTPRPALRKAPDADVHPAAPKHGAHPPATVPATAPARPPIPDPPAVGDPVGPAVPRSRAEVTPQPLPVSADLHRSKGRATSDALRGRGSDKLVDLEVRVPKSLRKRLRKAAGERGVSADELVALLLRNYLDRG